ncbi:MAG: RraA family protein [Sphingomonas sp.]
MAARLLHVSDALDRLELGSVVTNVPQQSGEGRIAGRAITVKLGVGAPSVPPRHLCTTAIERGGPENVIVIEQRSGVDAGSWGGMLTVGARANGIAGVVIDGPVRDVDEARAFGFPVFCRATTARTARRRIVELATDVPVTFETVTVEPGDYVLADRSGIAFVRPDEIGRVLDAAEAIAAAERAMLDQIEAGVPIGQVMAARYETMVDRA